MAYNLFKINFMKRYCFMIGSMMLFLLASCGKNGAFPTIPNLTFKSIGPSQVSANDTSLVVTIECGFKDAQGDIAGYVYFRQNNNPIPGFDSTYSLPNLPAQKNMQGNLILQLHNNDLYFPLSSSTDTVTFDLYIKDSEGHTSDTIHTSPIVLITP